MPQAELKFKLRTQPLGDIQLQIDAVLVDGSAAMVLPTSLDTQPITSDGSALSLPFSASTWSTTSLALLQVGRSAGVRSTSFYCLLQIMPAQCQTGSPCA